MNYEDRDTLGMYKDYYTSGPGPDARRGPGEHEQFIRG